MESRCASGRGGHLHLLENSMTNTREQWIAELKSKSMPELKAMLDSLDAAKPWRREAVALEIYRREHDTEAVKAGELAQQNSEKLRLERERNELAREANNLSKLALAVSLGAAVVAIAGAFIR